MASAGPSTFLLLIFYYFFLKDFIYFQRKGKEGKKGEKHGCARRLTLVGCLSHTPSQGPGLQSRHVPWLGIELVTFRFAGWHSIHWATPARAQLSFLLLSPLSQLTYSPFPNLPSHCALGLGTPILLLAHNPSWRSSKNENISPDQWGSVGWASSLKVKGHWLDYRLRHMSGLQVQSWDGVHMRGNWLMFLSSMFFTLSSPL